jgi:hypothetical protein
MNNITTGNLTAIVAVLMAATLVVGTFATVAATQQSAFAIPQKKPPGHDGSKKKTRDDNGSGNGNGNTVTIEECKNRGSASGFDTTADQECENLLCTHPGNNATCVQEGAAVTTTATTTNATATPKTCEECITTFLTPQQITALEFNLKGVDACQLVEEHRITEDDFKITLIHSGVSGTTADDLIACLKNVGIVFLIR